MQCQMRDFIRTLTQRSWRKYVTNIKLWNMRCSRATVHWLPLLRNVERLTVQSMSNQQLHDWDTLRLVNALMAHGVLEQLKLWPSVLTSECGRFWLMLLASGHSIKCLYGFKDAALPDLRASIIDSEERQDCFLRIKEAGDATVEAPSSGSDTLGGFGTAGANINPQLDSVTFYSNGTDDVNAPTSAADIDPLASTVDDVDSSALTLGNLNPTTATADDAGPLTSTADGQPSHFLQRRRPLFGATVADEREPTMSLV